MGLLAHCPNFLARWHNGRRCGNSLTQMAHGNFFMGSLTHQATRAHVVRRFQQFLSQPTVCSLCHVSPLLTVRRTTTPRVVPPLYARLPANDSQRQGGAASRPVHMASI